MKDKDHTYEKAIQAIRELSPQLNNPEEFSRKIISGIEKIPQVKRQKTKLLSLVSGIAATLLICFWGYEIIRFSEYPTAISLPSELFTRPVIQSENSYTLQEKITLYHTWQREQQKSKERQKLFISTLSNLEKTMP